MSITTEIYRLEASPESRNCLGVSVTGIVPSLLLSSSIPVTLSPGFLSTVESLSGILPSDLMVKITACLPTWSLIPFRCVYKSWHSFLSKPYFMTTWMNRCGTTLLVVPLEWVNRNQYSLVSDHGSMGMKNLKLPSGNRCFSLSLVCLSNDGAITCLTGLSYVRGRERSKAVILWSPFTGEIKALGNQGCVQCHRWPVCTESLVQGSNLACFKQYLVHGFG
ncbi:uncharacterized protein J3R85_001449 [Psidium guajava]|nr:uncharacterized protein J3R85_001449 [Psidium guajava]